MNNPPVLPKVSVIIAVYGNAQFLPDAITSAINQDFPNLDVWVVDDCSPDKLPMDYAELTYGSLIPPITERLDEIESFARYNPRHDRRELHYIRLKKNGGPSRARNIAIVNAIKNGSMLFQILDSDDVMYPNKVTELVKPIFMDPERVGITYADYIILNENGLAKYESKLPYSYEMMRSGQSIIHSGAMISLLAFQRCGLYPEDQRVAEDYSLFLSITKHFMAIHIPMALTTVRSHKNDSTNNVSKEIWSRDYQKALTYR